jgi:hypothetical protein
MEEEEEEEEEEEGKEYQGRRMRRGVRKRMHMKFDRTIALQVCKNLCVFVCVCVCVRARINNSHKHRQFEYLLCLTVVR